MRMEADPITGWTCEGTIYLVPPMQYRLIRMMRTGGTLVRIKIISGKPGPRTYQIHWAKERVRLPHLEEMGT